MPIDFAARQEKHDPRKRMMQQVSLAIDQSVSSRINPVFYEAGHGASGRFALSEEAKMAYHTLFTETGDKVHTIFPMPYHRIRSRDYMPTGSVVLYESDAKLTPLMFLSPSRIGEFVGMYEVVAGRDLTHLFRESGKHERQAIEKSMRRNIRQMAANGGDGDGSRLQLSMRHRGVQPPRVVLAEGGGGGQGIAFDLDQPAASASAQQLMQRVDTAVWQPDLGSDNYHASLVYSFEKVYIMVYSNAERSSVELAEIMQALYTQSQGQMTLHEFMTQQPWYELHLQNSARANRRLAYEAACAIGVSIRCVEDKLAHVNDPNEDALPKMGVPSVFQAVNIMVPLRNVHTLDGYERYISYLAPRNSAASGGGDRELSEQDLAVLEEAFPVEPPAAALDAGAVPAGYAMLSMTAYNPAYHPYSQSSSASALLQHSQSGSPLLYTMARPSYLNPADELHAKYAETRKHDYGIDLMGIGHGVSMPLEQRFVVLVGPEEGGAVVRKFYHDTEHLVSVANSHQHAVQGKGHEDDRIIASRMQRVARDMPGFVGAPVFSHYRHESPRRDHGYGHGHGHHNGAHYLHLHRPIKRLRKHLHRLIFHEQPHHHHYLGAAASAPTAASAADVEEGQKEIGGNSSSNSSAPDAIFVCGNAEDASQGNSKVGADAYETFENGTSYALELAGILSPPASVSHNEIAGQHVDNFRMLISRQCATV
jgi:hypothetical protein